MALGAGAGRIVRQMLTEMLLLAGLGAAIGIPLATWLGQSLWYLLPPTGLSIALDIEMNATVLGFTTLVCVAAVLASGMAPALHMLQTNLSGALKEGGRSATAGVGYQRIRKLFVVAEVALALVALIGAGLFVRSFQASSAIDPGFDPSNVLVSRFDVSASGYTAEERRQLYVRLQERLGSDSQCRESLDRLIPQADNRGQRPSRQARAAKCQRTNRAHFNKDVEQCHRRVPQPSVLPVLS